MLRLVLHQPRRLDTLQQRSRSGKSTPASPAILLNHPSDSWNSIEETAEETGKTPRVGRGGDMQCHFHRNKRNRKKYGKCEPVDPANPRGGCTYCYQRGLPCDWRGSRKEQKAREKLAQERIEATSQWFPLAPPRFHVRPQARRANRRTIMGNNTHDGTNNRLLLTPAFLRKRINCSPAPAPAGDLQRRAVGPTQRSVPPRPGQGGFEMHGLGNRQDVPLANQRRPAETELSPGVADANTRTSYFAMALIISRPPYKQIPPKFPRPFLERGIMALVP